MHVNTTPDWDVAILDGQPEAIVNTAAVVQLMLDAPCGYDEAMRRIEQMLPNRPDLVAHIAATAEAMCA